MEKYRWTNIFYVKIWINYYICHWSESALENGYRMPLTNNDGNKKVKILSQFLKEDNNEIISFDLLDGRKKFY